MGWVPGAGCGRGGDLVDQRAFRRQLVVSLGGMRHARYLLWRLISILKC